MFGFSQANFVDFIRNIPFVLQPREVVQIPGEKFFRVVVCIVDSEGIAKAVVDQLLTDNIVANILSNGKYVVFIGGLETSSQAESVLKRIRNMNFQEAKIFPPNQ